ncbi:hypothetical protein GCM10010415_11620 [Streptomyces atrovirens]
MLPAAVPCRETTWNGSASSGHPQYGQDVPVVPVAPVVLVMVTPWILDHVGALSIVATRQGCFVPSVRVQVDFVHAIVKRGLHD